jgi:hypothetical protein
MVEEEIEVVEKVVGEMEVEEGGKEEEAMEMVEVETGDLEVVRMEEVGGEAAEKEMEVLEEEREGMREEADIYIGRI